MSKLENKKEKMILPPKHDVSLASFAPYLEWVVCDLCGSDDYKILYPATYTEHDFSTERFRSFTYANCDYARGHIVRCKNCGMVYMNPRDSDVASLYNKVEEDDFYFSSAEDRIISFRRDLEQFEKIIGKINSKQLLDVGCSYGFLLDVAVERGWKVWGSELSKKQSSYAAERHPGVCNNAVSECNFPSNFFDAITAYEILEHVSSPREFLKDFRQVLRPGGYLAMTTPNVAGWEAKLMGRYWLNLIRMHLYYFSPGTIRRILEEEGFTVISIKHHYRIVTLGSAIRWMKKYPIFYYPLHLLFGNRFAKNWRVLCGLNGNITVFARKNF